MTSISGIPATRITGQFIRQQVLQRVWDTQAELARLQTQLSTGYRFELPSEDPAAALRAMGLQRLLERREQIKSNLTTNQSYLAATDTALSTVSGLIAEVRGVAVAMMNDATVDDDQRAAAVQQVESAIGQLVSAGNQKFRDRYLFAGSITSVQPFRIDDTGAVEYVGNERQLLSYSDVDMLFASNVTGSEVFGAISEAVLGSADLDPILTDNTRLADLRGGEGISPGSIAISDGVHTSIVDLSTAETIGDVAALIRTHPPETRTVDVEITATGLVIQLDSAPGSLSIREVGNGTTACELGILTETGVGSQPVVGEDLDPILRTTTRLDDILGTRARAVIRSAGSDNDLILEADVRGELDAQGNYLNGAKISYVDDATLGHEWVAYTPSDDPAVPPTIEIHIEAGQTKARHVVSALNDAYDPVLFPFTARLDPLDEQEGGQGLVCQTPPGEEAQTAGGSGFEFDQDAGLQIVNGGKTYTISLASAETIEDVLKALNGSEAGLLAEINETATGINVRSRVSGADFAIGENGGQTATQLGLRTFAEETRLEDLSFGRGVVDYDGELDGGADFTITRADGVTFQIDVGGAVTIGDVIARINDHPDNLAAGVPLVARLATVGNGIELVDDSAGPGTLTVTKGQASDAAVHLGLIPEGEQSSTAGGPGSPQVLTGADVHPLETEGIFTALLRLKQGLEANDLWGVERAVAMLDAAMLEMNLARADLGARQQGLENLQLRLDSEEVELRETLSLEYEADLVEVASSLSAAQVALEAALTSAATIFQMTLLDYL